MEFFNIIKEVISKPKDFFTKIHKEKGIKNTFLYFFIFTVITTFLSTLYFYRSFSIIEIPQIELTSGLIFWSLVILYIVILLFSIIAIFVVTGIIHLFVLLMKGKEGFYQTFKIIIYGATPSYLLSIILSPISIGVFPRFAGMKQPTPEYFAWILPIIVLGIIVTIYQIYLRVIGTKKLHKLSTFRAFAAILLLPLALAIVLVFIAILFFSAIGLR